jgi:hypothetical protein
MKQDHEEVVGIYIAWQEHAGVCVCVYIIYYKVQPIHFFRKKYQPAISRKYLSLSSVVQLFGSQNGQIKTWSFALNRCEHGGYVQVQAWTWDADELKLLKAK